MYGLKAALAKLDGPAASFRLPDGADGAGQGADFPLQQQTSSTAHLCGAVMDIRPKSPTPIEEDVESDVDIGDVQIPKHSDVHSGVVQDPKGFNLKAEFGTGVCNMELTANGSDVDILEPCLAEGPAAGGRLPVYCHCLLSSNLSFWHSQRYDIAPCPDLVANPCLPQHDSFLPRHCHFIDRCKLQQGNLMADKYVVLCLCQCCLVLCMIHVCIIFPVTS